MKDFDSAFAFYSFSALCLCWALAGLACAYATWKAARRDDDDGGDDDDRGDNPLNYDPSDPQDWWKKEKSK